MQQRDAGGASDVVTASFDFLCTKSTAKTQ